MKMCRPRVEGVSIRRRREARESHGWRSKPSAERVSGTKPEASVRVIGTPSTLGRPPLSSERFLQSPSQLLDLERFQPISLDQLAEPVQSDPTFEALLDFAHIVLEPLERLDPSGPHRLVAAHEPDLLRARDLARRHHAAV